jgi:DNA repair photolyase
MAPMLPGISDSPEQIEAVVRAARAAGACGIWASPLHLRPGTREHFLDCLARDWPELLPRYEGLYGRGAYLPGAESAQLRDRVRAAAHAHSVRDRRRIRLAPPPEPEQLTLLSA